MRQLAVGMIRAYQLVVSPLLPRCCRFTPSCSQYAIECIRSTGVAGGSWLALRRFWRCSPLYSGGYDPPPRDGSRAG